MDTIVSVKETSTPLSDLLFPARYRRKALALLLLTPDRALHVREIARITGSSAGTMRNELDQLERTGLLRKKRSGNQMLFSANPDHPVFTDLVALLKKTIGLAEVIASALAPLADQIDVAFVFGSIARATETAVSDVDVAIIGDIGFGTAVNALYPAQTTLQREINPKVFTKALWLTMMVSRSGFAIDISNKPKIFVVGTQNDLDLLGRPAEDRAA